MSINLNRPLLVKPRKKQEQQEVQVVLTQGDASEEVRVEWLGNLIQKAKAAAQSNSGGKAA